MIEKMYESMFQNVGVEDREIQTTWHERSTGRTTMYLGDPIDVLRGQISVSEKAEDLLFPTTCQTSSC